MKWIRPGKGHCLQCVVEGQRYIIQDDMDGMYFVASCPVRKPERYKFGSYREMYIHIAGHDPEGSGAHHRPGVIMSEKEIQSAIRSELTTNAGAGDPDNLREYSRDGQSWAVDIREMRVWSFTLPQRISGKFMKESEAREWADMFLEEQYGQMDLFEQIKDADEYLNVIHERGGGRT